MAVGRRICRLLEATIPVVILDQVSKGLAPALRRSALLGEQLLDRIEIGGEKRQIHQARADSSDRFFDASHLASCQIVEHGYISGRRCGASICST
jgi:hypothetical protein